MDITLDARSKNDYDRELQGETIELSDWSLKDVIKDGGCLRNECWIGLKEIKLVHDGGHVLSAAGFFRGAITGR